MPTVTLYIAPQCRLCARSRAALLVVLAEPANAGWTLAEVDIRTDPGLARLYRHHVPVVGVEGRGLLLPPLALDATILRRALAAEPDPALWIAAQAARAVAGAQQARERRPTPLNAALTRHWLGAILLGLGIWVTLPWLAPVFARFGWWDGANAIYTAYLFFCHQLPERAGYLFGYQAAWCYRNTALYTSLFLAGLLFAGVRQAGWSWRWLGRGISWQLLVLLSLPILVDGLSHMGGLRADNTWFDTLTGGRLGAFSAGDTLGTLNWWLRIVTGALCGTGVGLFLYPRIARVMAQEMQFWPGSDLAPPAAQRAEVG